jgi:hypothetical protein
MRIDRTRRGLPGLVLMGAVSLLVLINLPGWRGLSLQGSCQWGAVCALSALAGVALASPRGVYSASFVYALVFFLFHFGLITAFAVEGSLARRWFDIWGLHWFWSGSTREAIGGAVSCFCAYGAGTAIQTMRGREYSAPPGVRTETFPYAAVGLGILLLSLASWLYTVISSAGFSLISASYAVFLNTTRGMSLPFAYFGIGLGLILLCVGRWVRTRTLGLIVFACWSIVVIPLGVRGAVFFPGAAALVVVWMKHPPRRIWWLVVLAILGLIVITLARQIRSVGLGATGELAVVSANPVDGLLELGGSLRPVVTVVDWIQDGETPLWGNSYWAPVERLAHHILPLWEKLPSVKDERLLNVLIQRRMGPIGFSPVAEAYYNFLWPGAVLIMFLMGVLLGSLDRLRGSEFQQAVLGIIFLPLLLQVRNDFSHVPGQILGGLMFLVLMRFIWRLMAKVVPYHGLRSRTS